MSEQWRPVVAALANDRVREVYARLVLGSSADDALADLAPSRRRHIRAALLDAGLVTGDDLRPDAAVFARVLAAASTRAKPTGALRFLSADGRLLAYPSQHSERHELLGIIARRTLAPGEVVTEPEINERLERVSDDVAVLRRYLVDHEFVERTRSGTEYALVEDAPQS